MRSPDWLQCSSDDADIAFCVRGHCLPALAATEPCQLRWDLRREGFWPAAAAAAKPVGCGFSVGPEGVGSRLSTQPFPGRWTELFSGTALACGFGCSLAGGMPVSTCGWGSVGLRIIPQPSPVVTGVDLRRWGHWLAAPAAC